VARAEVAVKARARTAVATGALLVAAAAAVLWAAREEKALDAGAEAKAREERLFGFAEEDVTALRFRVDGEETRAVREGEGWRIVAPVEAPGERAALDGAAGKLATLKRRSEVAAAGAGDLGRFGLASPRAEVEATLADGRKETLALGDESSFDGSIFARPTSGGVVAVPSDARWALEKRTFDLREKRVLPLDEKDLARVVVHLPGAKAPYALRREGGRWLVAAPFDGPADPEVAARITGALRGLRATAFRPPPAKPARPAQVDLSLADGTAKTLLLAREPSGAVLAWQDGAPDAAVVDREVLDRLAAKPEDLREKPAPASPGDSTPAPKAAPAAKPPGEAAAGERG
jgi:hypothetical protein